MYGLNPIHEIHEDFATTIHYIDTLTLTLTCICTTHTHTCVYIPTHSHTYAHTLPRLSMMLVYVSELSTLYMRCVTVPMPRPWWIKELLHYLEKADYSIR